MKIICIKCCGRRGHFCLKNRHLPIGSGTWDVFENGKDLSRIRRLEGHCRPGVMKVGPTPAHAKDRRHVSSQMPLMTHEDEGITGAEKAREVHGGWYRQGLGYHAQGFSCKLEAR